jgi:hypothetical protein
MKFAQHSTRTKDGRWRVHVHGGRIKICMENTRDIDIEIEIEREREYRRLE